MRTTATARLFTSCLVALAAAMGPPVAEAQRYAPSPGARVRVTTDGARIVGTLVRSGPNTLVVATDKGPVALLMENVNKLEVGQGRRANKLNGAKIGLLIGVVIGGLGAVIEGVSDEPPREDPDCDECSSFHFGPSFDLDPGPGAAFAGLTVLGVLVGTVAGAAIHTEQWEQTSAPVSVGALRPTPDAARPLPALTVRIALR